MATRFKAPTGYAGGSGRHTISVGAFFICLIVTTLSIGGHAEQSATHRWQGWSALHTILPGHQVRVTMIERAAAVTSHAVIELRDRANRVVMRKSGDLTLNTVLQLDLKVGDKPLQLSAFISVQSEGSFTAPLVTFEDINPALGLVSKIDPPCGPGSIHVDPQAYCPGWLELTSTP